MRDDAIGRCRFQGGRTRRRLATQRNDLLANKFRASYEANPCVRRRRSRWNGAWGLLTRLCSVSQSLDELSVLPSLGVTTNHLLENRELFVSGSSRQDTTVPSSDLAEDI